MPLDRPTYPGEAEINLAAATLTSAVCTNPAVAIDDDPATAAMFGQAGGMLLDTVTVNPLLLSVAWFGGGVSYPAGQYQIVYVTGAFSYTTGTANHWTQNTNNSNLSGMDGMFIAADSGPAPAGCPQAGLAPGFGEFASQAAVQAANAGASSLYTHPGGKIGLFYLDEFYGDNSPGSPNPTFSLYRLPSIPPLRFLRVDWGFDAFVSRIRLAYDGPGAGNVGVDYESAFSFDAGHNPPVDVALSYLPSTGDGHVHEVVFSPPVFGRGAVFYPDALLPAPSSLPVNLYQLQVYQDITQGVLPMANPTITQARTGCSGLVVTPRGAVNTAISYPFPQGSASALRSIQNLDFTSASKLARETGGETVHQINGYETDREVKVKFSIERHDYLALQNILAGTLIVDPASGNGPETQYFAPGYNDRVPYFSLVGLSVNGDPSAELVMPKCKIDGNLAHNWERDKVTTVDVDFVLFWDALYTRQDGQIGGLYELVFNNGGAIALHS